MSDNSDTNGNVESRSSDELATLNEILADVRQIRDGNELLKKGQELQSVQLHELKVSIQGQPELGNKGLAQRQLETEHRLDQMSKDVGKMKSMQWLFWTVFGIVGPVLLWIGSKFIK